MGQSMGQMVWVRFNSGVRMGKLTAKTVESLVKAGSPGLTNDGEGLYFQISKAGGVSWVYRYKAAGRVRDMGLGRYPVVSLAGARALANDARKIKATGNDPLAARDTERAAKQEAERKSQALRITFETLALEYQQAHGAAWSEKWRNGWRRKLELYVFPIIGKRPAAEIQTEHVLKVLSPIWSTKTRTADEVRSQIEQVLDAAKAKRLREGDNPARWRGHLDNLLSKTEKKNARQCQHFAAMKWQDVPALMATLSGMDNRIAVALRLLVLTGARSRMVRFAAWSEIDLSAGVWSLPIERMKGRKAFEIPLPPEAVELLQALPRIVGSPYLFPGQGKTGVMDPNALRNLLIGLEYHDITRHGFRSTFRDWASERTHCPREICEMVLAHDERSQTEGAYSRSDFFDKRRELMQAWAQFITTPPAANVIQGDFKRG